MVLKKNARFTQPHYPCPDANPFLLMNHEHFSDENGPKVYWAGNTKEEEEAFDPDFVSQSDPSTLFPKTYEVIRATRCVRLALIAPIDDTFIPFVKQVKKLVKSIGKGIYFQHSIFGEGKIVSAASVPWNANFVTFDDGATFPELDITFFDTECLFTTDVLTFGIGGQNASVSCVTFDMGFTNLRLVAGWPDIIAYYNKQFDQFPRYRLILQPAHLNPILYPGATPGGANKPNEFAYTALANDDDRPKGWEIGPSFNFDLDYIEATIRDHWRL